MAYAPPSYQATAYRQLWLIIAPYVNTRDLYSTCLVSRQWHAIFAPLLWGDPASRFGVDSDTVYISLTRFKRLLTRVRLHVRSYAHTLHIPPASPEFYDGPQAGWLRDILDRLPALQALIVSNLSFFDHESLRSIHYSSDCPTIYPLKLLTASNCENTTASSLTAALHHFPHLIFLDLSGSQGSRSPQVLRQIGTLSDLKILRLSGCGLRDDDIENLTFTNRLRSLDVSHNLLTERGLSILLSQLPAAAPYIRDLPDTGIPSPSSRGYSSVPLPTRVLSEGFESFVQRRITSGLDGYLSIEEGLPSSLSHLYLASNYITINGVSNILDRPDLHQLDVGSINLSQRPAELLTPRSPTFPTRRFSDPPEIEVLSPSIFTHAFRNLRSLRIHHSIITSYPFTGKELSVSEQCFELHSDDLRHELDSTELIAPDTFFELADTSASTDSDPKDTSNGMAPSEEIHASFESPDDVGLQVTGNSPTAKHPHKSEEDDCYELESLVYEIGSRSSLPRSIPPKISVSKASDRVDIHSPISPGSPAHPPGPLVYRYKYTPGPEKPWREVLNHPPKARTPKELIEQITQRRHRIEARERHPGRFKPCMLPNLKTLTLTDVPSTTRIRTITTSLSLFIQECAEEEELARLESLLRNTYLSQHPNSEIYRGIYKLRQLTLEMTSLHSPTFLPGSPLPCHQKNHSFTKSSTEDADSEMFMHASSSDFSFFAEDDGGLLVSEGKIDQKVKGDEGMMCEVEDGHLIDVVSELAGFRREKKRMYEVAERFGRSGVEEALLGHWRGEIKVLRGG